MDHNVMTHQQRYSRGKIETITHGSHVMTRGKRMPLFDDLSTALSSIKKIKNVTSDDDKRKASFSGKNHLYHRHVRSDDILPQLQPLGETSDSAVNHTSNVTIIDAGMEAKITSDMELIPHRRKKSNPFSNISMNSQRVRNGHAPGLCKDLSLPIHKNKNDIPSRSCESWSEDNLLNAKQSDLSSLNIPIDRDHQSNTEEILYNLLEDFPRESHMEHQPLKVGLQFQSQRKFSERDISQILTQDSELSKYGTYNLMKKPYYEHPLMEDFEEFGFPTEHIVKGSRVIQNKIHKTSRVLIDLNVHCSSKTRRNHRQSESLTRIIQAFPTKLNDAFLKPDDEITEYMRAQVNEIVRTTNQRTKITDQDVINVANIMEPSIRFSEDDNPNNFIVRAVKSCDESISDLSELGTDLNISITRIPYCTSTTKICHEHEEMDIKVPVVDECCVSKSKINSHSQRIRGFLMAPGKIFSLFTVSNRATESNNFIHVSTSTPDQQSVKVSSKPKITQQRVLHDQSFTQLHDTNKKKRILSKNGSHKNLSLENEKMRNLIKQIGDHNESSLILTQVNDDEISKFSTEDRSNNSCIFLREPLQSTSHITESRSQTKNDSRNDFNSVANLSNDEYIVAYYEDGPRVFRLEQIYSIGNLESIMTGSLTDSYAYGTDDSIFSKNYENVLANQVYNRDRLNEVDGEVSAHYDRKKFSRVDPRPLRYDQITKNHDYTVSIDGFSSESYENKIRCPECAYFAGQSNCRYPLPPPSKEWELMYTQSEFEELKRLGGKAEVRLNANKNRRYPLTDNKRHLATQNRNQKSTNSQRKTHRLENLTHSNSYHGIDSISKAKQISLVLLFSCFLLSPILFPVYFLGGYDYLMSFLTKGKISQCNQNQKRWALWACIPSWLIAMFLIGVIIWWTYL